MEKGYKDFYEVLHDEDLNFIRSSKEYDQLVKKYVPQKFIDQMNEEKKKSMESVKRSTTSVDSNKAAKD